MARAAVAAGSCGIMLEVHPEPERALSDAGQALRPAEIASLIPELHAIHDLLQHSSTRVV